MRAQHAATPLGLAPTTVATPMPAWLDRTLFPFDSRFIDVIDCRLHYVDEGDGPVLLFLHGSPMWSFMYRHCIRTLSDRYRCVAVDMPGLGLSTAPVAYGHQFARNAEAYRAFIRALDLRALTIIAHATAVPSALLAAAAERSRLAGCVITNGFGWPIADERGMMGRMARVMGTAPVRMLTVRANLLPRIAARFAKSDPGFTPSERAAVVGPYRAVETRRHLAALLYGLRAEGPLFARVERDIAALRDVPVLLLYGADDHGCRAGFIDKWRALLPQSDVHVVADSNHFSPEDRPIEYATALGRWLDRHVSGHDG